MNKFQDYELIDFILAFWRRKWTFMLVSVAALAAAAYIISKMPITYQASGLILVEQQEIPTQWVQSTVASFVEERIESIGQQVLTVSNLSRIIDKFDLFSNLREKRTLEELVGLARKNFSVESVQVGSATSRSPKNATTIAFRISYVDSSAEASRDVVKELVSLYLQENLSARTEAAIDTRKFLEAEADRIEQQLSEIEQDISNFKEANLGALPEQLSTNTATYDRVDEQISNINQSMSAIKERQLILQSSIDSARRLLRAENAVIEDTDSVSDDRLAELEAEYLTLKTRYSASHPDLIRLRREIGLLQQQSLGGNVGEEQLQFLKSELQIAKNKYSNEHPEVVRLEREVALWSSQKAEKPRSTISATVAADDSVLIQLRNDLASANAELISFKTQKNKLRLKLEEFEERISKTPAVEREYRSLIRDHENIQDKYNDIREKQNSARVAESLEFEQKGERFTLIEAPRLPQKPFSPEYQKLFVMAIMFALASGLMAAFGLELFDGRIRNSKAIETLTQVPVLASIGCIKNSQDKKKKTLKMVILILILMLTMAAFATWYIYSVKFASSHSVSKVDSGAIEDRAQATENE